ncbi:GIY-YIG nuclease family protein [Pseudoalteromonas ostreae]|uniref:GIY-YIG nuclease family protein n=1 Tax=Pseudoalteromonas ostreae TaxID=2774154 RepID=UPI001B39961A|nr:GIY-YIG nuclease family protein [Pseudoalteromonas ostreae]
MDTDRGTNIYLYVLKLQNSKLYVGQSIEPEKRIKAHFKGKGSAWTRLFPPIEIIKQWDSTFTDWKLAEVEENLITLTLMQKFGWKNVRGGYWSNIDENSTFKGLQKHISLIKEFGLNINDVC